jgi:hypothetical protein
MKIGFRNTYAQVVGTAALVLTLGGTGYAATSLHHSASKAAGSLPTTLASQHSLKGAWGQSARATDTGDVETDTIAYPMHLKRNVTAIVVQQGSGSTRNCPGTRKSPKARPGFLCVYVGGGVNHGQVSTYSPIDGNDLQGQGNYKYGAVVFWNPAIVDFAFASGTWAVTAK